MKTTAPAKLVAWLRAQPATRLKNRLGTASLSNIPKHHADFLFARREMRDEPPRFPPSDLQESDAAIPPIRHADLAGRLDTLSTDCVAEGNRASAGAADILGLRALDRRAIETLLKGR